MRIAIAAALLLLLPVLGACGQDQANATYVPNGDRTPNPAQLGGGGGGGGGGGM